MDAKKAPGGGLGGGGWVFIALLRGIGPCYGMLVALQVESGPVLGVFLDIHFEDVEVEFVDCGAAGVAGGLFQALRIDSPDHGGGGGGWLQG